MALYVPHILYPFTWQWTLRCCYEHRGACIFSNDSFVWIYAQEWGCWIIWWFCFSFSEESLYSFPQWLHEFTFPPTGTLPSAWGVEVWGPSGHLQEGICAVSTVEVSAVEELVCMSLSGPGESPRSGHGPHLSCPWDCWSLGSDWDSSSITRVPGNVRSPTDSGNGVRAGLWVESGGLVS